MENNQTPPPIKDIELKKSKTIKRADAIRLRNAYNEYVSHLAQELYCLRKPNDNRNPTQKELDKLGNDARATLAEVLKELQLT